MFLIYHLLSHILSVESIYKNRYSKHRDQHLSKGQFVLKSSRKDLHEYCFAPIMHPDPLSPPDSINSDKYQLRLVQLVINQGLSAPKNVFLPHDQRGSWLCGSPEVFSHYESVFSSSYDHSYTSLDRSRRIRHTIDPRLSDFPPSCNPNDLLIQGFEEQFQLGEEYKKYYVQQLKFLPEEYFDPTLFYVHATGSQNAIDSAISFMQGFYNPTSPNEILSIERGGLNRDHFDPQLSTCNDLKNEEMEFISSDIYKSNAGDTNLKIKYLYEYLNITYDSQDFTKIDKMCNFLISGYCSENIFLPNETQFEAIFDTCMRFNKFMLTDLLSFTQKGISGSPIMRELNKLRNDFFSSNDRADSGGVINGKRFQLISAHDTAIVSLLLLFTSDKFNDSDVTGIYGPPFASHLAFEFYEQIESHEIFLRLIYNGKEVNLFGENKTFLTVHEITNRISPLIKYCDEFGL